MQTAIGCRPFRHPPPQPTLPFCLRAGPHRHCHTSLAASSSAITGSRATSLRPGNTSSATSRSTILLLHQRLLHLRSHRASDPRHRTRSQLSRTRADRLCSHRLPHQRRCRSQLPHRSHPDLHQRLRCSPVLGTLPTRQHPRESRPHLPTPRRLSHRRRRWRPQRRLLLQQPRLPAHHRRSPHQRPTLDRHLARLPHRQESGSRPLGCSLHHKPHQPHQGSRRRAIVLRRVRRPHHLPRESLQTQRHHHHQRGHRRRCRRRPHPAPRV